MTFTVTTLIDPYRPIQPQSVLLADSDTELCGALRDLLGHAGFDVCVVRTGMQAVERGLSQQHAILVLDSMLPDVSGFEVLRQLRSYSLIPVIILTKAGNERDRILGLEMGADDSLPKPFSPRELAARIAAVLRRFGYGLAKLNASLGPYCVEDIEIDPTARSVRRAGCDINLTTAEFNLLQQFLASIGRVVPREDLVRAVLGREFSPLDRSIDTHVSNLRKKLGPKNNGVQRIKSVRGIGYIYVASPKTAATR